MVSETPPAQQGALVAVGGAQNAAAAKPTHDLESIKKLATQTNAIGIILPPPDIRAIVDKTAQFVAKNGACGAGAADGGRAKRSKTAQSSGCSVDAAQSSGGCRNAAVTPALTLQSRTLPHLHTPRARAGVEFERRILAQESQNVKFNFLTPTDPYHAFYKLRVRGEGGGPIQVVALGVRVLTAVLPLLADTHHTAPIRLVGGTLFR